MNSIRLTVKSFDYNCIIKLNKEVTVLSGDSGTGKSALVSILSKEDEDVEIRCVKKWVVIFGNCWEFYLESLKNTLIVIDNNTFIESELFMELIELSIKRGNRFILVGRIIPKSLLDNPMVEVQEFKCDGINHWAEPINPDILG